MLFLVSLYYICTHLYICAYAYICFAECLMINFNIKNDNSDACCLVLVTFVNCCTCYHCEKLMNSQQNSANKINSCAVMNYVILDSIRVSKIKSGFEKISNESLYIARKQFCKLYFINISKFIKQLFKNFVSLYKYICFQDFSITFISYYIHNS